MAEHLFTPGPWMYQAVDPWKEPDGKFVQWGAYRVSANSLDMNDKDYYFVASVSNVSDSEQNEANARLIAAAPELVDALGDMLELVHDLTDSVRYTDRVQILETSWRALLIKATEGAQ